MKRIKLRAKRNLRIRHCVWRSRLLAYNRLDETTWGVLYSAPHWMKVPR